MTNQRAFGGLQIIHEQIDIAGTFKMSEQIFFVAEDDAIAQLANAFRECCLRNRNLRP